MMVRKVIGWFFLLMAAASIYAAAIQQGTDARVTGVMAGIFLLIGLVLFFKKSKSRVKTKVSQLQSKQVQLKRPFMAPDDANEDELAFFDAFEKALIAAGKSTACKCTRMSNNVIAVNSSRAWLGKIKLQGKSTWMQYMTSLYNSKTAENKSLEEYIALLKYWVKTA